jgi:uracil DNA glycosylase
MAEDRSYVEESRDDSPAFIDSKSFSKANKLLRGLGRGEIDWNLTP